MRLIVECEHGEDRSHSYSCGCGRNHRYIGCPVLRCDAQRTITDPDAILEALVEAGVLEREWLRYVSPKESRYVSPWKEAK